MFDSKAEAFIQPFFSQSTGTAIRSFESAANSGEHDFNIHAGDYTLFELGAFDQATAKFEILAAPLNLGTAITFIRSTPPHNPMAEELANSAPLPPTNITKLPTQN